MKSMLRRVVPKVVLDRYQRWRVRRDRAANARRPIGEVFQEVYARRRWGGAADEFCSGCGSAESHAAAYATAIRAFARCHGVESIVDLGCGDYRVGQLLRTADVRYVGVDIVPALIDRNRSRYGDAHTDFVCRDLLRDDLPAGDLCLVRQVLQHLSNSEIATALTRLNRYPYVIVTEHYPAPGRIVAPNLDKPHGPDTRILDGSGVFLDEAPFHCTIRQVLVETPVEYPLAHPGEMLRTLLVSCGA